MSEQPVKINWDGMINSAQEAFDKASYRAISGGSMDDCRAGLVAMGTILSGVAAARAEQRAEIEAANTAHPKGRNLSG